MKFDTPATTNPIDQLKVVGKPVDRIEGKSATGTAPYSMTIRRPRLPRRIRRRIWYRQRAIVSMDLASAQSAQGRAGVVTAAEAGPLGRRGAIPHTACPHDIEPYHQAFGSFAEPSSRRELQRDSSALIPPLPPFDPPRRKTRQPCRNIEGTVGHCWVISRSIWPPHGKVTPPTLA